jgi:hypothetical protein
VVPHREEAIEQAVEAVKVFRRTAT